MAYLPLTLDGIKAALVVESSDDDEVLSDLIDAAIEAVEAYTGLVLKPGNVLCWASSFSKPTLLRFAPVVSVVSIRYVVASTGLFATLPVDNYVLIGNAPKQVVFRNGAASLPTDVLADSIELTVAVGAELVPAVVVRAVTSLVGAWYNNPEAVAPVSLSQVPLSLMFLLDSIRVRGVAF
jgi:uncharacterized phiE125 gp8 family phage protein